MKGEQGFTMPMTLMFSFILFTFLIHQANMLILEKKFYQEAEEMLLLDIIMQQAIDDTIDDVQITLPLQRTYSYDFGSAVVSASGAPLISVAIECKTNENRTYKASFQYNKDTKQIIQWTEER